MRRLLLAILLVGLVGCGDTADESLTIYSGRSEALVEPLIDQFREETGINVSVRYAGSTELAATLLEEGSDTPADVFFAQDPASLGAVADAGLLATLPSDILDRVPAGFSDGDGHWVGVSGRARVAVVSSAVAVPPADVESLLDPTWEGRVGIAPGNGSFLSFVAAFILTEGEDAARQWLDGIAANDPVRFEGNSSIVAAVNAGEVDVGLVNHYYLLRLMAEEGSSDASNVFIDSGGAGALVMPAGAAILADSPASGSAERFIEFLLSDSAQTYFATETFEFPMVAGIGAPSGLPAFEEIDAPPIDLGRLGSVLDRATDLVAEAGLL